MRNGGTSLASARIPNLGPLSKRSSTDCPPRNQEFWSDPRHPGTVIPFVARYGEACMVVLRFSAAAFASRTAAERALRVEKCDGRGIVLVECLAVYCLPYGRNNCNRSGSRGTKVVSGQGEHLAGTSPKHRTWAPVQRPGCSRPALFLELGRDRIPSRGSESNVGPSKN